MTGRKGPYGFDAEYTMPLVWSDSLALIDWNELSSLYLLELGPKKPADLKVVFSNSRFRFFAYDGRGLIGAGRAVSDGADISYICDVAVHPDYQGQGIGKDIVARLVELSRGHKKIILYSAPGKEPFYRKIGFRRMATAMAIFEDQDEAFSRGLLAEE
jgi:ribosomal protein S18 acetylase RimI-like enzyme